MAVADIEAVEIDLQAPGAFVNRELSWLQFAHRVLELSQDTEIPLLERIKFAGIVGMLHDEFFMKRMSGLKRQIAKRVDKVSLDGRTPQQEFDDCRKEILAQVDELTRVLNNEIRPALAAEGIPMLDYEDLDEHHREELGRYFKRSVLPILTPLAVDAEHPFPFISGLGLNLAVILREKKRQRFVRIKVPSNRNRWVPLHDGSGFVPLEQVIAANLGQLFPTGKFRVHFFRLTRAVRGADTQADNGNGSGAVPDPGSIVQQVSNELKARKFAGAVRLEVSGGMPKKIVELLTEQLAVERSDLYVTDHFLRVADLIGFDVEDRKDLRYPPYEPAIHPRLRGVGLGPPSSIFDEICRGDILLHHPYHSFDTSVLHFLQAAAVDERVLAIKLTIYRTSSDSPILRALVEAARRGKQVAVLVEITARFDEAPNIAWGRMLEEEGVHVAYGVEKLKTHVKLAMVVREEGHGVRRYVHVGTGNYHTGTARIYEDFGMLSCDPELSYDVASVFNELTGATQFDGYSQMLVAPRMMRLRFVELIRREAEHAAAGRPAGISAKMNQLQDPEIIRELYRASRAGVPIDLNVRGLCCLRPGVPGLSESIRVFSVLGRFLEHGRIYRFENAGDPEYLIGSADWMKRNLDRRVETIAPVNDEGLRLELDAILRVYIEDNHSAWDMAPDGSYSRRRPEEGETPRASQDVFMSST
jgi:polyphosphate kinase